MKQLLYRYIFYCIYYGVFVLAVCLKDEGDCDIQTEYADDGFGIHRSCAGYKVNVGGEAPHFIDEVLYLHNAFKFYYYLFHAALGKDSVRAEAV